MSNVLQTIPSPMKIRDELERVVLADLLGPIGGEGEEIDEPSVRKRYLVGIIAARNHGSVHYDRWLGLMHETSNNLTQTWPLGG